MASSTKSNQKDTPGGKTPYIDASTARDAFEQSNNWFRPYFDPIDEFERIARNKPSDRIPKGLPKVTDGTTAAIVQEDPKRIIQQLATGIVECEDYPEYAKIADLTHRRKLIPMYTRMGTALQKQWNMLSKAKTWGRSTSYTFFTSTNGVYHTDFVIPYVKDIITEKGKVYAPDSNISFMRSWYQKSDLQRILKWEQWREKNEKGYKSDWDLNLLAKFINTGATAKPADLQTPAEKEKGGDAGGYEVIHAFQEGQSAEFYAFAPRFEDGVSFRTKINSDPRGKMPLDHEYNNIDLSNPLGRGSVEASGGVQNLMDQQMQMFQFLTTLLMGPPLQVWGTNVNLASLKFRPNAIWEMGTNQQNRVEPYQVSNHAIQGFASNYGLLKSQIYALNSAQDHSISAEDVPGQSKTQAGVKAAEARLGTSDNFSRLQHEAWFNDQAETSINLYFAEMNTTETMKLDKEDVKELSKTEAARFLQGNILTIPFDKMKEVSFKFQVDAGSSEVKEDEDNAAKLADTLKLIQASQDPTVRAAEVKVTKLLLDEIGAKGTDDLFPEEETDENGNPIPGAGAPDPGAMMQQIMPQVQQMVAEMLQAEKANKQEDPTISLIKALGLKYDQLPDEARQIVMEQVGFGGDEIGTNNDPIEHKQNIDTLDAMNKADAHERQPLLEAESRQFQAGESEKQRTAEQQRQEAANRAAMQSSAYEQQGKNASSAKPAANDDPLAAAMDENETILAQSLMQRGFTEDDIEQAIVMQRQGMPLEQVIQTLGAKYAAAR